MLNEAGLPLLFLIPYDIDIRDACQ